MRHTRSRILVGAAVAAATALVPAVAANAVPDVEDTVVQRVDDRPDDQSDARRALIEEAVAQVINGEATPVTKGKGQAVQVSRASGRSTACSPPTTS